MPTTLHTCQNPVLLNSIKRDEDEKGVEGTIYIQINISLENLSVVTKETVSLSVSPQQDNEIKLFLCNFHIKLFLGLIGIYIFCIFIYT